MKPATTLKEWSYLILLVLFWGSSFAMTKLALQTISAEWIVFLRLFVSTLILTPIAYLFADGLPKNFHIWLWYIGLAVIGSLFPFLLITEGMQAIDSSLGAILISTTPLFVLCLAHIFLKDERMSRRKVLGFLIGFAGIILLMNPKSLLEISLHADKFLGQIALLAAAFLYASHMVATRFLKGSTPLQTMTGMSIIACVLSFAYAFSAAPHGLENADTPSLIYTTLLGIFPTAIAGVILYHLVRVSGARFVSLSNYLLPVVGLLIGTLFLDEDLQIWVLLGMGLIFIGIWISEFGPKRSARAHKG